MAYIKWGELGNYLNTKLLRNFDFRGHISQEIVDEINEFLTTQKGICLLGEDYKEWDQGVFCTENRYGYSSFSLAKKNNNGRFSFERSISYKHNTRHYVIETTDKHACIKDDLGNYIYLTTEGRIKKHGNRFKLNQSADIE